jgi:RNA polymerase sigma factor (sigma-70 family)
MNHQAQLEWLQQLQQHAPMLFSTCWHFLQDAQLTEDAVQEVYLTAMMQKTKYDPQRPLDAWLHTIARNTAISIRRKRRGRTRNIVSLPDDWDLAEEAVDAERGPVENALQTDFDAMLKSLMGKCCLPSLSNSHEEALRLKYFERLKRKDIAARMGKTESAVGGYLKHGMRRLRAHFQTVHTEFVRSIDWS